MNLKRVAVLMGGISVERDVSLSSGKEILAALQEEGYQVIPVDVTRDIGSLLQHLTPKPDVVFNTLHGRWGEDGCIQGLLEWLHIPYTHSGVLASALAMDKPMALSIFQQAGLRCAPGRVISYQAALQPGVMDFPYVIKPVNEGSSLGVHIIHSAEDLCTLSREDLFRPVLIEKYIPGREIQVAVLGDEGRGIQAIGAIEIRPKQGFYDYKAKYTEGFADHLMPAPLAPEIYKEALTIAETAHRVLGCRGVSRVDLRYDDTQGPEGSRGTFYILELNTQPGMTPLSLVPEIAAYHGVSYGALVAWMVESAYDPTLGISPAFQGTSLLRAKNY